MKALPSRIIAATSSTKRRRYKRPPTMAIARAEFLTF
jgi:hypothetical protein